MDNVQLVIIVGSILGIFAFGGIAYFLLGSAGATGRGGGEMRDLMSGGAAAQSQPGMRTRRPGEVDPRELDVEMLKKRSGSSKAKSKVEDVSSKLFKAGFFTAADRKNFLRFRIISFGSCAILMPVFLYMASSKPVLALIGLVLGALVGFTLPMSWLERQIRKREDELLYYLPLVVEQVSIGVSSALDVGPCVSHIVAMATERDSHNAVTEMFVHVEKLVRSGLSLEDALIEVGEANGTTEVKHAFMFLGQCARHGGEISSQLQELADSVMTQRQVQIEGKIAALPVKATGPLAMVFAGFFALLFAGLFVRLLSAFGG